MSTSNTSWLSGLVKGSSDTKEETVTDWKEWRKKRKAEHKQRKEEKMLKKLRKEEEIKKAADKLENDNESSDVDSMYTVSIALPGSILDNAQSLELRTYLAGQIARAASIFNVDEIIIFESKSEPLKEEDDNFTGVKKSGQACAVMGRLLEYLECPQYLRKYFFPLHPDLKYAGLLNPLDCPHHLRIHEDSPFREGCTLDVPSKPGKGSFVDVGLRNKNVRIDKCLQPNLRVTVRMLPSSEGRKKLKGQVVHSGIPRKELGLYWGYSVRLAKNFKSVFTDCPYKDGYDLTIGTSDKGSSVDELNLTNFRHLLIVFGGLSGLESYFEEEDLSTDDPAAFFNHYLNTCPNQGSRTIRTEEALVISLSILRPKIIDAGQKNTNNN